MHFEQFSIVWYTYILAGAYGNDDIACKCPKLPSLPPGNLSTVMSYLYSFVMR